MGKEEPKRGRKASGVDLTANEIRDIAYRVAKIASRLHGIADDMDGVGIPVLRPTPGYRADLDALEDKIEKQFERRLVDAVKRIVSAERASHLKQKYAIRP